MKKLYPFLLVLILLMTCLQVSAMNTEKAVGEVLYHQKFEDISDFSASGIRIGTASTVNASVTCPEDALEIVPYDSGRVFVLLPDADKGDSGSYTIEFTFSFSDIRSDNGYIAPILTCRGLEPTNITSLKIRADGSVDLFSETDPILREAIRSGEEIGVRIPVENGVLREIHMAADGMEYTLERENVLLISDGSIGFSIRNTGVSIGEVFVVCGTDYTEKNGYYADQSYACDGCPVVLPEDSIAEEYVPAAPPTGDETSKIAVLGGVGLVGLIVCIVFLGKKKR